MAALAEPVGEDRPAPVGGRPDQGAQPDRQVGLARVPRLLGQALNDRDAAGRVDQEAAFEVARGPGYLEGLPGQLQLVDALQREPAQLVDHGVGPLVLRELLQLVVDAAGEVEERVAARWL